MLAPYRGMGAGAALLQRCLQLVATQLPEVSEAVLHVQVRAGRVSCVQRRLLWGSTLKAPRTLGA